MGSVAQSCPPLLQPHGLQLTRLLCPQDFPGENTEWVALPISRGSSQPRDQTCASYISCIGRRVLNHKHHLGALTLIN